MSPQQGSINLSPFVDPLLILSVASNDVFTQIIPALPGVFLEVFIRLLPCTRVG